MDGVSGLHAASVTLVLTWASTSYPCLAASNGNSRQVIFASDTDFQCFRDALVSAAHQHGMAIYAYVWMGNPIHRLATPEHGQRISKEFQSVGRRYVQDFNATYKRTGTLWEGRYRARWWTVSSTC